MCSVCSSTPAITLDSQDESLTGFVVQSPLTGQASFQWAVPWLLLFATTTFALGPRVKAKIESYPQFDRERWVWLQLTLEFCVYIYCGYFGLGMGIILFAI